MEADGLGNGVDEDGIGDRGRNDVGKVDFEEVGGADDGFVVDVANFDEDEEDGGQEV